MVSVHDPEMRHGHKSSRQASSTGTSAAIVVDTDTQLITCRGGIARQRSRQPGGPGTGGGKRSQHRCRRCDEATGRRCLWRRAIPGRLSPTREQHPDCPKRAGTPQPASISPRMTSELHLNEVTAAPDPAGRVTRKLLPAGKRTGSTGRTHRLRAFRFDAAVCGVLNHCGPGESWPGPTGMGRTVQLHPQEALLQEARALQQSEAFAGYRQRRVPGGAPSGPAGAAGRSVRPATSGGSRRNSSCTWQPQWLT